MSIEQVESVILELGAEARRQLLFWLDEHRHELFAVSDEVMAAPKAELMRRPQDCFAHPDRFLRVDNETGLGRFFEDIRREVEARLLPARPA